MEGDFRDADGVLICGECGMPLEDCVETESGNVIKFPVIHYHDLEMEQAKTNIAFLKAKCFDGYEQFSTANLNDCKYEDKDTLMAYVVGFEGMKRSGKGMILYGPPGRGKTYAAACVLNALMERKVKCKMTTMTQIMFPPETKSQRVNELRKYDLVCIDDYGSESSTSYGRETGFEVINRLYSMGKPVIVTTNFDANQLRNPPMEYIKPIERLKSCCSRLEFSGPNLRQVKLDA